MRSLLFLLFLAICTSCGAQKKMEASTESTSVDRNDLNSVASWKYEVKKLTSTNEYMITANVKLDKGWHVFDFKPGGDGFLIAPEINFSSKDITILDKQAVGKLVVAKMAGMEESVRSVSYTHLTLPTTPYV